MKTFSRLTFSKSGRLQILTGGTEEGLKSWRFRLPPEESHVCQDQEIFSLALVQHLLISIYDNHNLHKKQTQTNCKRNGFK